MLVVTFIPGEELLLRLIRQEALYYTECHETNACVNVILINITVSHYFINDRCLQVGSKLNGFILWPCKKVKPLVNLPVLWLHGQLIINPPPFSPQISDPTSWASVREASSLCVCPAHLPFSLVVSALSSGSAFPSFNHVSDPGLCVCQALVDGSDCYHWESAVLRRVAGMGLAPNHAQVRRLLLLPLQQGG